MPRLKVILVLLLVFGLFFSLVSAQEAGDSTDENGADETESGQTTAEDMLSVFVVFFVVSVAIERIIEVTLGIKPSTSEVTFENKGGRPKNITIRYEVAKNNVDFYKNLIEAAIAKDKYSLSKNYNTQLNEALKKYLQIKHQRIKWAGILGFVLGMAICYALKISFLSKLGFALEGTFIDIPLIKIDYIITGLIVGSGTKPIHDIIGFIEKAKM